MKLYYWYRYLRQNYGPSEAFSRAMRRAEVMVTNFLAAVGMFSAFVAVCFWMGYFSK